MKQNLFFLIILDFLLIGCNRQSNYSGQTPLELFSDSLFQTNIDSSYIAGASIIVYQKGEKLLDKSYGYASLELSAPMPENPSFEIGSVTKQFTSAAILKLVEQGKLSLDDDFTKYLEFDTKGRTITISHLLNHTSGIVSNTEVSEFWNLSLHQYERDSLVRLIEQKDFLFEPGEALIYNNSAYFFLGLIIEKVSGMSYEEYLGEQFFIPLGMNNTYYCSTSEVVRNKVYGYSYSQDGLKQKSYIDHTWPYAGGSLCSTANDLLVWLKAIHEGKIFNDQLYKLYISPGQLKDGSKLRYAMGLYNYSNYGNSVIGHGGGIHGFLSETRYFPEADLYIICFVNTSGPKGSGFFAEELTWKILPKKEIESANFDTELKTIEGKYSGQGRRTIITIDVSALSNSIIISVEGRDDPDTLQTYIGNNKWMNENNILTFANDELRIDDIYGYYKLQKQ
jgi:CubicO group peptidase (beta-lactamase class C family)